MDNKLKALAVVLLSVAGLAGCATADAPRIGAAPVAEAQVLRPLPSYGSLGGYRYRRFVVVNASAS